MTMLDDGAQAARPIFADVSPRPGGSPTETQAHDWTWINWTLSLLTATGAALLMAFALGRVADTTRCSTEACPGVRVDGELFGLLYHGAVVVAALTLFLAFFFTTHRRGVAVCVGGWTLLLADLTVLLAVF